MAGIGRRTLVGAAALLPLRVLARTPAPANAVVYVIWPREGARVHSPFTVRFGLTNMGVTHAGDETPNLGHHHLLVDVSEPLNPDEPIPSDRKHLHFGAGQTETQLDLPPGWHSLQLVLGDAKHIPFEPVVASKIVRVRVIASSSKSAASGQ